MKPLLFSRCKVKDNVQQDKESWELLPISSDSPILHAAWNPFSEILIVNLNQHKENLEAVPTGNIIKGKKGEGDRQETTLRNVDTWYRVTITDKDAVQHILNTLTDNYIGQEWDIHYELAPTSTEAVESQEAL